MNRLERAAALFLLCFKERYQITQTALDFAMKQVQQMVGFAIEDVQQAVELQLPSINSSEVRECFKVPDPFLNLRSEYMQTKYYKENFGLIVSHFSFCAYDNFFFKGTSFYSTSLDSSHHMEWKGKCR